MNVVSFTFCPSSPPCVYNCRLVSVVRAVVRAEQGAARLDVISSVDVKFQFLMALSVKLTVLWGLRPYSPIDRHQRFGGICLHTLKMEAAPSSGSLLRQSLQAQRRAVRTEERRRVASLCWLAPPSNLAPSQVIIS
jgi:negative regulator of sigma E activity